VRFAGAVSAFHYKGKPGSNKDGASAAELNKRRRKSPGSTKGAASGLDQQKAPQVGCLIIRLPSSKANRKRNGTRIQNASHFDCAKAAKWDAKTNDWKKSGRNWNKKDRASHLRAEIEPKWDANPKRVPSRLRQGRQMGRENQ